MFTVLNLLPFAVSALALPATLAPVSRAANAHDPQVWTVPRFDLHYVSPSNDSPGTQLVDFDIKLPFVSDTDTGDFTANCRYDYANGNNTGNTIACTGVSWDEHISFNLTSGPSDQRPDISFIVTVYDSLGWSGTFLAKDGFTPSEKTLTCSNGGPSDGLTCHLDKEITFNATYN